MKARLGTIAFSMVPFLICLGGVLNTDLNAGRRVGFGVGLVLLSVGAAVEGLRWRRRQNRGPTARDNVG